MTCIFFSVLTGSLPNPIDKAGDSRIADARRLFPQADDRSLGNSQVLLDNVDRRVV